MIALKARQRKKERLRLSDQSPREGDFFLDLDLKMQESKLFRLKEMLSPQLPNLRYDTSEHSQSLKSLQLNGTETEDLNEQEDRFHKETAELAELLRKQKNEQKMQAHALKHGVSRKSMQLIQSQMASNPRKSFIETSEANSNQQMNLSNPIRVSNNELISEQNLEQVDRLTQRQVIANSELFQASSDRLKDLLSKPSNERTESICESIANEIIKVKFLAKYRNIPGFLDICKHIYIKVYERKQFIFRQGEKGDAFYIILQGSVTIYIDEPTEQKRFMQLKEVARLEQGDSFGEIALIYDSHRTATIIANERSYLIVLEKSIFSTYIKEMKNDHLSNQVEFLDKITFCRLLTPSQIMEITTKLQTRTYTSNEIIGHEGETLPNVIFLKWGRAKIYRSIKFRINKYSKQKQKGDIKDPSPEEIAENQYITEMIEIDEISDFSVIGEYSLLYNKPLDFTIITLIPTEVYYISSYDLIKIVPPDSLEKHRKLLKKYPNNLEIRQMYWEKRDWESFQQKVIQNIHVEKENKKGFEQLLKKPTKKFANFAVPINVMDIQSSDNSVYLEFLSQRVPRGLQTKQNVIGLQPIHLSISKPTSQTALSLWEKLQEMDGINPLAQLAKSSMHTLQSDSKTPLTTRKQKPIQARASALS